MTIVLVAAIYLLLVRLLGVFKIKNFKDRDQEQKNRIVRSINQIETVMLRKSVYDEDADKYMIKLKDFLNVNASYVFFRILPEGLPGPIGALGVPITSEDLDVVKELHEKIEIYSRDL